MNCFKFSIFEVVQAKLFEHQIIENNLYNNGQRIRNCKLFYCTIFIMLSNNSFLSTKIRFFLQLLVRTSKNYHIYSREGLEIIDDSDWKKSDAVKKEISRQCLKFFTERGIEPHYADCLIRWKDNYETVEVRIAIGMDSDTEKDDDIFFYCDTLEDMKSLAEIGSEDFYIADCYNFGVYEDLL